MIFAAILVYFAKERIIQSDGLVGFTFATLIELIIELAIIAAIIAN